MRGMRAVCAFGIVLGACSAFDSTESPNDPDAGAGAVDASSERGPVNARIACGAAVCENGNVCCERENRILDCTTRDACGTNTAYFCDGPEDCATGACCIELEQGATTDYFAALSVSCRAECRPNTASGRAYVLCDPQAAACGGKDCIALDSLFSNDVTPQFFVCN